MLTGSYCNDFVVDDLHLELNYCQRVLDSDVSALSACPSLECLHLEHNPVVEDPVYRSVLIQSLDARFQLRTFVVCHSHMLLLSQVECVNLLLVIFVLSLNVNAHFSFTVMWSGSGEQATYECYLLSGLCMLFKLINNFFLQGSTWWGRMAPTGFMQIQ